MFKALRLTQEKPISTSNFSIDESFYRSRGLRVLQQYQQSSDNFIGNAINSIVNNQIIDVEEIWDLFFPINKEQQFHIFLSHSHRNIEEVHLLVGLLKETFGINTFVDSLFWGNFKDLLLAIDNKYSDPKRKEDNSGTIFNYEKCSITSAIIHNTLASALTKAIDSIECFIFYESEEAVQITDIYSGEVGSPWIHHELLTSKLIRTVPLEREDPLSGIDLLTEERATFSDSPDIRAKFPVELQHLTVIDWNIIRKAFMDSRLQNNPQGFLDYLYIYGKSATTRRI